MTLPQSMNGLLSLAERARNGAETHQSTLALHYNPATAIEMDRTAAFQAYVEYQKALVTLRQRYYRLNGLRVEARSFAMLARDILKPRLGRAHSDSWAPAGFARSLEVPRHERNLVPMLTGLHNILIANPAWEGTSSGITAAEARRLADALTAARAAVDSQEAKVADLLNKRDDCFEALQKRLRGLIMELKHLIGKHDERWLNFGFNIPGQKATPEPPTELEVISTSEAEPCEIRWKRAPRAAFYRVFKREAGSDGDWVFIGRVWDPNFTLEKSPSSASTEIAVTAVNDSGESRWSEAVELR